MVFFKRLSRGSHSRSASYAADEWNDRPRSQGNQLDKHDYEIDSPRQSTSQHNNFGPSEAKAAATKETERDMYHRSQMPHEPYSTREVSNGANSRQTSAAFAAAPLNGSGKLQAAPDLLTQAFNDAVRPYSEKIEQLEGQMADLQAWADQLEAQRNEMYAWIDKRGLRPDVPPSIGKAMDAQPDAAITLNAQLDRKITIVNFDLHRLQDDLNDSVASAHFASAMAKFLPDIKRLSSLSTGPRLAFDLILKLGGNLNSHGGLDAAANTSDATADLAARRDFYARLDTAMLEVVNDRFHEGEDWPVGREIKRIEKTAAYLRTFGIEPYFPKTLDAMRREVEFRHAGGSAGAGAPPQAQSPPKY